MKLRKVIDMCERHGFLKKMLNKEMYKVGPTGALLQENLRTEWFNNVVINKDVSVFINKGEFMATLDFAKEICLGSAPFGIVQQDAVTTGAIKKSKSAPEGQAFSDFFENGDVLKCWMFVGPTQTKPFFHQWQSQRRKWWRKISASPGRYSLIDTKTSEQSNNGDVQIMAKYPWGKQAVETLTLHESFKIGESEVQVVDGRKTVAANCITSEICLSTMFLNTLCDAYDEPPFQDKPRPLLRFHRKLAPYKISFAISMSPKKSVVDELKSLAVYLCQLLRTNQISTLLTPLSYKHTLEAQAKYYDQLGIPYNIVLNENTIKTGVVQLRSRDTTLKEQVNVTNLVEYVGQLFRNY